MIQIHAGDDRHIGIKHIHRIQAPAQPHFQHHHLNTGAHKHVYRRQGVEFKISKRHIAARRFDALKAGDNVGIGHRLAIQRDAFVKAQQMRAGERAHFVACFGVNLG